MGEKRGAASRKLNAVYQLESRRRLVSKIQSGVQAGCQERRAGLEKNNMGN